MAGGQALSRELTDSLLHTNIKRVIAGIFCGLAAGALMLLLTTFLVPEGAQKMWWLQLLASICHGGNAFNNDISSQVLTSGVAFHFFFAGLCGLILGKLTTTKSLGTLAAYGLVLGALCWLSSNMFGPDFLYPQGLWAVGQWLRGFLFVFFTITSALLLGVVSRMFNL